MTHRRGLGPLAIASTLGRVLAVVQSAAISLLLSPEDYGAFAAALGVLMFTGLSRAGGIWMVLGSIPSEEFKHRAPPVFWVGKALGTLVLAKGPWLAGDLLADAKGLALYALILISALQIVPSLRAASVNVAEPGLDGLKRFAQRRHLPIGD